jgi:carbon monoxide dehydrogenase subunit G
VKISGSYTIDAPQDQVWAALNDMEVLARIVPGCERLEQTGDNEFVGTVKIGIQAIKGTYSGRIRLEDIQPPHHYKLVANGRSANGVVDGAGTVDLTEEDGKTTLKYGGDAQIGGMLASVGQRLIEGASKQMINQSLKALTEQIALRANGAPNEPAAPDEPAAAAPTAATAPAAEIAAAPVATPEPVAPTAPPEPAQTSFEPRTVVVPAHEQLKPESVALGMVEDLVKERPWLPWVAIAFLLGLLIGRRRH